MFLLSKSSLRTSLNKGSEEWKIKSTWIPDGSVESWCIVIKRVSGKYEEIKEETAKINALLLLFSFEDEDLLELLLKELFLLLKLLSIQIIISIKIKIKVIKKSVHKQINKNMYSFW